MSNDKLVLVNKAKLKLQECFPNASDFWLFESLNEQLNYIGEYYAGLQNDLSKLERLTLGVYAVKEVTDLELSKLLIDVDAMVRKTIIDKKGKKTYLDYKLKG